MGAYGMGSVHNREPERSRVATQPGNHLVLYIVTSYRYATNFIIFTMFELYGCYKYGLLTTCYDIV